MSYILVYFAYIAFILHLYFEHILSCAFLDCILTLLHVFISFTDGCREFRGSLALALKHFLSLKTVCRVQTDGNTKTALSWSMGWKLSSRCSSTKQRENILVSWTSANSTQTTRMPWRPKLSSSWLLAWQATGSKSSATFWSTVFLLTCRKSWCFMPSPTWKKSVCPCEHWLWTDWKQTCPCSRSSVVQWSRKTSSRTLRQQKAIRYTASLMPATVSNLSETPFVM